MEEVNNHFVDEVEKGTFSISNNLVSVTKKYGIGQYVWILGSKMNGGDFGHVAKVWGIYGNEDSAMISFDPADGVADDTFTGAICGLAVPRDFVELSKSIEEWQTKNAVPSDITGESFAGKYSYTRAVGANGLPNDWTKIFADRLRRYRNRMFREEVL